VKNVVSSSSRPANWCIGLYDGASPLQLGPAAGVLNPVLTADAVTDAAARFVADPFMIRVDGSWHMFFEVMRAERRIGAIGHATSLDGLAWQYHQLVLTEPYHLSYPFVLAADGDYYLVPESHRARSIRLYRADPFPVRWSPIATLVEGEWVEPTLCRWEGRWWLFAAAPPRRATRLHVFLASELKGPWHEHPESPVVHHDPVSARPAGRVVVHDGRLLRFAQDCSARYGQRVTAYEIIELTARKYREQAIAGGVLVPSGRGWNSSRMHHIDPHEIGAGRWLACVDGDGGP